MTNMVREKRKMISGVLSIGNEDIIMNSWFSIYIINTYGNMNMDAHVYTHTHYIHIFLSFERAWMPSTRC